MLKYEKVLTMHLIFVNAFFVVNFGPIILLHHD